MNTRIELHQERNISQKLSDSFAFIKENFMGLMKPMLYVAVPLSLFAGYVLSEYFSFLFGSFTGELYSYMETMSGIMRFIVLYVLLLVAFVVGHITLLAIVYSYVSLYDEGKEKEISVFKRLKERIGRFIGYNLAYGAIVSVVMGMVVGLFMVPIIFSFSDDSYIGFGIILILLLIFLILIVAVVLSVFMYVLQPVIFFEDRNFSGNITRTFALLKGNWLNTGGFLILSSFIMQIAYGIFYIPLYIIMMINAFGIGMGVSGVNQVSLIIGSMIASIGMFLMMPLMNLLFCFQYYHLTEKKDGTGLLNKLGQLGIQVDEKEDETYL